MVLKLRRSYDQAIVLGTPFFAVVLTLKVIQKRTFVFAAQKPSNAMTLLLSRLSLLLADRLVVEAPGVLHEWGLREDRKASIGAIYVDTTFFTSRVGFRSRGQTVGYVGGLENSKGLAGFMSAIEILNKAGKQYSYVIAGSGTLELEVKRFARLNRNVRFRGVVPTEELPEIYSQLRLLVLPSTSEGLPNVLLEAMACGTPVLATGVGGIRDLILNNRNGFVLPDDSPETIAENVVRAIDYADLEGISNAAVTTISTMYTFECALRRYTDIMSPTSEG
jgi:glycosyltransferase involved in cell wall biosynthesis